MSLIERLFPAKTAITSTAIRAEIDRCEREIAAHQTKINTTESEIATLDDAAHAKIIESNAALRRAITRLESRVATLDSELPSVLAAEEAAQAAAKDEALRKRADECRKANSKEAKALLASYAEHANAIADVVARLEEIAAETNSVNQALRSNPVFADSVVGFDSIFRKHPDREASENTTFRPGRYEDSLETAVRLPPAFVGPHIWPRS